jgi:Tfp pilus assembly protein PilX
MAPAVRGLASERGTVLIAALMVIVLVGTLGAALVMVVSTESGTAANYQAAQQALYAADAGIDRAAGDLRLLASWRDVPAPASASPSGNFNDGLPISSAPDGRTLDLVQLTATLQAESNAIYPNTPNRPVWRLFGHASLNRMISGAANAPPYVVVWVADDPDDPDGDCGIDTNDVVMVHAEAFGIRGSRRAIEATIQREEAMAAGFPGVTRTDVRLIAWREVR